MDQWRIHNARILMNALLADYRKKNKNVRKIDTVFAHIQKRQGGEKPPLDHCALRSISGIGFGRSEAGRLFSALGYRHGGCIYIPSLHIASCFFEPPAKGLPKIFFSEILLEEFCFDERTREDFPLIVEGMRRSIKHHFDVEKMRILIANFEIFETLSLQEREIAMEDLIAVFVNSPPLWRPDSDCFKLIAGKPHLQEIASVIAYGFRVNHFAFLLKDPEYRLPSYTSMEGFAQWLRNIGLPMKDVVEGRSGSKFRQTSTRAVTDICEVWGHKNHESFFVEWPSSYVEFVERGVDPETGLRFEGFLPNQAKQLFKMTERR